MKRILQAIGLVCILCAVVDARAETPDAAQPSFLGEKIWTLPGWITVRATAYRRGGKCASGLKTRYASTNAVGSASVPSWIPRGSLIRLAGKDGWRVYLAVDRGTAVEKATAARKSRGIDKSKIVIDLCAPRQEWPDQVKVELYQYVGSLPYDQLTGWQKEKLMSYAVRYITAN